jgi:pimeloyl-ACP methyl ester carboxylesterase
MNRSSLHSQPYFPNLLMGTYTHHTAPTQFVEAAGIRFAYRRFGKPAGLPLVFLQHFTGTLDNWDPAVLDAVAADREVIIFDNAGVASSTGETASTVAGIASTAAHFIAALGLQQIDLLGFSMGGFVAQELTLRHPDLVRRLVLVGTGPRGGEGLATFSPEVWAMLTREYTPADELLLDTFFSLTPTSQAAGRRFLERIRARTTDRDVAINELVAPAQLAAIAEWGAPREGAYEYLQAINQPVLVVNGKNDLLFPTINSYLLQQHLPDARLMLYPDAGHGSLYQYPEEFVQHLTLFLNS